VIDADNLGAHGVGERPYQRQSHRPPPENRGRRQRIRHQQTERLAAESLSLPMYPELRLDELEAVTDSIRHWFHR